MRKQTCWIVVVVALVVAGWSGPSSVSHAQNAYSAAAFDLRSNDSDQFESAAAFNAFSSAITNGGFEALNPNEQKSVPFSVNPVEWTITPALGIMVVTPDNKNGPAEANLVKIKLKKKT